MTVRKFFKKFNKNTVLAKVDTHTFGRGLLRLGEVDVYFFQYRRFCIIIDEKPR